MNVLQGHVCFMYYISSYSLNSIYTYIRMIYLDKKEKKQKSNFGICFIARVYKVYLKKKAFTYVDHDTSWLIQALLRLFKIHESVLQYKWITRNNSIWLQCIFDFLFGEMRSIIITIYRSTYFSQCCKIVNNEGEILC